MYSPFNGKVGNSVGKGFVGWDALIWALNDALTDISAPSISNKKGLLLSAFKLAADADQIERDTLYKVGSLASSGLLFTNEPETILIEMVLDKYVEHIKHIKAEILKR